MKMRNVVLAGLMVCSTSVGMIAGAGRADANQVTTPGVACAYNPNGQNWSNANGLVRADWVLKVQPSGGVSNPDSAPHDIFCPIIYSDTGTGPGSLYVDGDNTSGSTTCAIYQYDFSGNIVGSNGAGFPTSAAHYDVHFTTGFHSGFDYFTLKCPGFQANNNSTLRGVSFSE